ncbi:hypothetical protein L1987_71243 [Smallanthus sonchifolius]|uniref:Uncharacterized protein n=1 Tax=Smallanthus sonchifolius TaxID=185202 RepID=A0ACB9ASJ2_9ASTR|nr:hypothetical protein L1987_71243 [Smallanthus sonchifolius]
MVCLSLVNDGDSSTLSLHGKPIYYGCLGGGDGRNLLNWLSYSRIWVNGGCDNLDIFGVDIRSLVVRIDKILTTVDILDIRRLEMELRLGSHRKRLIEFVFDSKVLDFSPSTERRDFRSGFRKKRLRLLPANFM